MSIWIQTWCNTSLDFPSLMQMLPTKMQMFIWCTCLLSKMQMQFSWCRCPFVGMPWCKCFDANIIYLKIFLYFQIKASSAPETKIFSKLDLLFLKSHLLFDLRLSKKLVITVRQSSNRALTWNLMIWLKRFIFTIWFNKVMARFKGLFLEKWILWKSSILKRFIF